MGLISLRKNFQSLEIYSDLSITISICKVNRGQNSGGHDYGEGLIVDRF